MICRLFICYCFLCFVDCEVKEVTSEEFPVLPISNCSKAEHSSQTSPECTTTTPDVTETTKHGDFTAPPTTSATSEELNINNEISSTTPAAENIVRIGALNDDHVSFEEARRQSSEVPEVLREEYAQKNPDAECFSSLEVKMLIKKVLEHIKDYPNAIDLIIDGLQYEIDQESSQRNPNYELKRSYLMPPSKPQTNHEPECPPSMEKYFLQEPDFITELGKYPQCLLNVFKCDQKFESPICRILPNILNTYNIIQFDPSSSDSSVTDVNPLFDMPINDSESYDIPEWEMKQGQEDPQYFFEYPPTVQENIPEVITDQELLQVLPKEQILIKPEPMNMDSDIHKFFQRPPSRVNIPLDVLFRPEIELKPIVETEVSDVEIPKPENYENIETYVEKPESLIRPEPEPINNKYLIPSYPSNSQYFVNPEQAYNDNTELNSGKQPKPVYVGDLDPFYITESIPVVQPFYFEESKPKYADNTVPNNLEKPNINSQIYVKEPYPKFKPGFNIYNIENNDPFFIEAYKPTFEESEKDQGKVYIVEPESVSVEQADPHIEKSKPTIEFISFNQMKPNFTWRPQSLNPVIAGESKPDTEPIYSNEMNLPLAGRPEPLNPVLFEESEPNIQPIYLDETPYPIFDDRPQTQSPIIVEESNLNVEPINLDETKNILPGRPEHLNPIIFENSKPKIEPIYLDGTNPMFIDRPEPLNPVIFEESKPSFAEESTTERDYNPQFLNIDKFRPPLDIPSRPAHNLSFNIDFLDVKPNQEPKINSNIFFIEPQINSPPEQYPLEIPTSNTNDISGDDVLKPNFNDIEPAYIDDPKQPFDYIPSPGHNKVPNLEPQPEKRPQVYHPFEPTVHNKPPTNNNEFLPEPAFKPDFIEELVSDYDKYPISPYNVDIPLDHLGPNLIAIENPPQKNIDKPESFNFKEPNVHVNKPMPTHNDETEIMYLDQPEYFNYDKPGYDQVVDSIPIHSMNVTNINNNTHTTKHEPTSGVYVDILPLNMVKEIINLIQNDPKKQIHNIIKVLDQYRPKIKPHLYHILISVLQAFNEGYLDLERFNEIFYYLIQPKLNNDLNNNKIEIIYFLLLPGVTGQIDTSTFDVIYQLIQPSESNSDTQDVISVLLPLLKKVKTGEVDQRINEIILTILNQNRIVLSKKHIEILLAFIKPNEMGYIPTKRIDIALKLVNYDELPHFSSENLNTLFLLIKPNEHGKVDRKAIEILNLILVPEEQIFLTEEHMVDLISFLGRDSSEDILPKRLDIVLFLLKNIYKAPKIIKSLIKSLERIENSKFFDIILYLYKRKMLNNESLEVLAILVSQEMTGGIDKKTLNKLLILLEPYRKSYPKEILDVYKLLNMESFSNPDIDVSKIPENLQVLIYYLMNPNTASDRYVYNGHNEDEQTEILYKLIQKLQSEQGRQIIPQILEHNKGFVELTYMLKDQKPILYHPVYYVKYKIGIQDFLKNVLQLIETKSDLIENPAALLRELIIAGSVSEISNNLQDFRNEDIIKLTYEDGNLIQAKLLNDKNLNLNDQIKVAQDLNLNVHPEELLLQNNVNAAKYYNNFGENVWYPGIGKPVNGRGIVSMGSVAPNLFNKRNRNSQGNNFLKQSQSIKQPKRLNVITPLAYQQQFLKSGTAPQPTDLEETHVKDEIATK